MTGIEIVGLVLALALMAIGLIGSIVPGLPGTPLVLIAVVGHKLFFGSSSVSLWALGVIIAICILALALDWFATVYGAKKLGATWRGMAGAILGLMIGLTFGPLGIVIGPFLGALLLEWMGRRPWPEASRAAGGAVLGMLAGSLGKTVCCLAMMALFTLNVLTNS